MCLSVYLCVRIDVCALLGVGGQGCVCVCGVGGLSGDTGNKVVKLPRKVMYNIYMVCVAVCVFV